MSAHPLLHQPVRLKEAVFSATDRIEKGRLCSVKAVTTAPNSTLWVDVETPDGIRINQIALAKVEVWPSEPNRTPMYRTLGPPKGGWLG